MKKTNFLLEIGTEEIPARFLDGLLFSLKKEMGAALEANGLGEGVSVETTGTMRRLVVFVKGLAEKQEDRTLEARGPSKAAAFDKEGNPTRAATGFAASQGVNVSGLEVRSTDAGEYVFAKKLLKGKPSSKVLTELVPGVLSSLHLPVSMKWGDGEHEFIRPVHYILALLGRQVLKLSFGGAVSSGRTKGHRFLFNNRYYTYNKGADLDAYSAFLKGIGVILDPGDRKTRVASGIEAFETRSGLKVVKDGELIDETSELVENPALLEGCFDKRFISVLPQDVISTVVKKQQKCFPVKDSGSFLIVADGKHNKDIVSGYEKVVNARLSDAKFFYDEDIKVPLEENLEKLKRITYHQKIGSMWDKTLRVMALSARIAGELLDQKALVPMVQRIAELSKADLATHMVGEFSGLSGIMGREYAGVAGEDARVCRGVFEQTLPRFPGDRLPEDTAGAVVGLADRIDSIVLCFSAGLIPTGSEDPYGLRRSAQGIVAIMVGKGLAVPVSALVEMGMSAGGIADPEVKRKSADFIKQRLKFLLEAEGVRYDAADSIVQVSDVLTSDYCRAFEINRSLGEGWFKGIVLGADRVSRIISGQKSGELRAQDLSEKEELALGRTALQIRDILQQELQEKNFSAALRSLAGLTEPLEVFFDKVLVMHKDDKIRENRIALLKSVNQLYLQFADFTKIVM